MENFINNFNVSSPSDSCNMEVKDTNNANEVEKCDTKEYKPFANPDIFNYQLFDKSASLFQSNSINNQAERIRRDMEERIQNPMIEDDIIEAFQALGKCGWSAVKSLFSKKDQNKEEREDEKDNKNSSGFLSLS